jgi:hypothetical protein
MNRIIRRGTVYPCPTGSSCSPVRFVQGDVTRLADLGVGAEFTLLMDGGCYHTIPPGRRDAYAESVTRVAAPQARFILVGFSRPLGAARRPEGLLARFPGWRLVQLDRVPGEQMYQYVAGPAPCALPYGTERCIRCDMSWNAA